MPVKRGDALTAGDVVQSYAADTIEGEPVVAIRRQQPAKRPALKVVQVPENYWDMVASYERSLRATGKSETTIRDYRQSLSDLANFLTREGIGLHVEGIQREHLERWIGDILTRRGRRPGTALTRYNAAHAWFNWLVARDELDASPMRKMHSPKVPLDPPSIIPDDHLERLIKVCSGRGFRNRRDLAMIRVLLDTGIRRGGLCDMRTPEAGGLDIENGLCRVTSKTKTWTLSFGPKTVDALDAYLSTRKRHIHAALPELWLSDYGALTGRSINGILDRRAAQAGIPHIFPHQFKHTFAHTWLAEGGQETDLMHLAGWSSRAMLGRYGASAAHERAITAHKNKRLGDRV